MSHLGRIALCCAVTALLAAGAATALGEARVPAEPAEVRVTVTPAVVDAGGRAEVTIALTPKEGIAINRYPKIKFSVAAREGLVAGGETAVGNDAPPPVGRSSENYFHRVDPITLPLDIDAAATSGEYDLEGRLTYFFCVKKSGFCAPSRTAVKVPLTVR